MTRQSKILIAIIFIAFAVRLVPSLVLHYPAQNDAAEYSDLGRQLAEHLSYSRDGVTPYILRTPGYPVFLAVIYFIFGYHQQAAIFIQVLLSVLVVWLIYLTTLELTGNPRAGLVAAALAAVYPLFIYYNLFLYSENLAIPAMLVFVLFFVRGIKRNHWPAFAAAGLAFTALVLTKSIFLPILFFAIGMLIWQRGRLALPIGLTAFLLPVIIVIGGWTARNYAVFHIISPFGVGLGRVLYVGNNPAWGALWPSEQEISAAVPELNGLNDIDYDNLLKQKGFAEITRAPLASAKLAFIKAIKYLGYVQPLGRSEIFRQAASGLKARLFTIIFYYYIALKAVISILFLYGIFLFISGKNLFTDKAAGWFIAGIAVYALAVHAILFVDERYHLPAFPLHLIFASVAAIWLFDKIRTPKTIYD